MRGRKAVLTLGAVGLLAACSDDSPEGAASSSSTEPTTTTPAPTAAPTTAPSTDSTEAPGYAAPGGTTPASVDGITRQQVDDALGLVDGFVEDAMEATGIPGVAVAVVYDDEVVFAEGYGVRDVGTEEPVSVDTVFQLASLSKPITGTAVAGLVSDGVIAWDEPVHPYAPDLVLSDPWVTDHVTFADLYSHRSGLPGGVADSLEVIGYTRDEILARLRFVPLNPFRATYAYTNFGMTAGGDAAARAAGVSFEDMMDQQLFEPAGMTTASVRYTDFLERPDRATIHARIDGNWVPGRPRQPDAQAPAGGVSASLMDMTRWLRLQLDGGTLDGEEIVGEDALLQTHTPHIATAPPGTYDGQTISYGLGWNVVTDHLGYLRWAHSGAFDRGASTNATLLPEEGLGVIVLTNGMPIGVPETLADEIIDQIATGGQTRDWSAYWSESFGHLYAGDPALSERPDPPTPARAADAYLGSYANDFYGTFEVIGNSDSIALVEGPDRVTFPLTHWDADTFTYVPVPENPESQATVSFTIGPDGRATSLDIGDFDGAGLGTLTRV